MGSQFFRVECYASIRSQPPPTKKKKAILPTTGSGSYSSSETSRGKISALEVIAEATRAPDATPHVPHPKPPICLHGESAEDLPIFFSQIQSMADEQKIKMADGKERKQRTDTPILLGIVASYPEKADEKNPLYVLWKEKTVDFLRHKYGEKLCSILEHTDENFGHIHAFVVDAGRSVKSLHDAHHAQSTAALSGASRKAQGDAYKTAGRLLQDDYQRHVGISTGLARIGPARPRLTRLQWVAEKQINKARANAILEAEQATKKASIETKISTEIMKKNALRTADLITARDDLFEIKIELEEKKKALHEQEKKLNHKENLLQKLSQNLVFQGAKLVEAFSILPTELQEKLSKIFHIEPRKFDEQKPKKLDLSSFFSKKNIEISDENKDKKINLKMK